MLVDVRKKKENRNGVTPEAYENCVFEQESL